MSHLRIWHFDQDCSLIVRPGVSTAVLPAFPVTKATDRADRYLCRNAQRRTEAATTALLRELKRQPPRGPRFYGVALVRCPGKGDQTYQLSFAVLGPRNTIVHGNTTARTLGLAQYYTQRYLASVRSGQPDEQLLARM